MISARICISGAAPLFNLNKYWLSINWNVYWFSGRLQCLLQCLPLRLRLLLRPCLCRRGCCKFFYYHQLLLTDYTTVRVCVCVCIFSSPLVVAAAVNSFAVFFFLVFLWEYRVTDTWNPLNTFVVRTLLFINLSSCLPAGLLFLFCLLLLMKPSEMSVSLLLLLVHT